MTTTAKNAEFAGVVADAIFLLSRENRVNSGGVLRDEPCSQMQLYRLMTDVRAGADHAGCAPGQAGIATIWVRADSEEAACESGRQILATRNYESHGELQLYLEEATDDPAYSLSEIAEDKNHPEGEALSAYSDIKRAALDRGDGLFEAWFP